MAEPIAPTCPYCTAELPPRRVQCGAPECARQHRNQRQRDYFARYKAEHGVRYEAKYRTNEQYQARQRAYRTSRVSTSCHVCGSEVLRRRASVNETHRPTCRSAICLHYMRTGQWYSSEVPARHASRSTPVPDDHPCRLAKQWVLTGPRFISGYCLYCTKHYTIDRAIAYGSTVLVKYCSIRCGKRAGRAVRRAKQRNAYIEAVSPIRVYERDRYRCHLCGRKVRTDKAVPHPMAATIDHVVPLDDDGDHSYANASTAHYRCNTRKGTRGGGEQLALIG